MPECFSLLGALAAATTDISLGPLVVNVGNRAEAKAFADADPFQKAGMFTKVTITRMRKGQWNPEACEGA